MAFRQPWMDTASKYLGLLEKGGAADNPEILNFATIIGGDVAKEYIHDSIPWCGLFVAFIMAQNGIKPVDTPLWARNWATYGKKLSAPAVGCIMTFVRDGGGHVGFYVSEDKTTYHILGGNQSDSVSITKIAKTRCIGYNWPPKQEKFLETGRKVAVHTGKLSTNEA